MHVSYIERQHVAGIADALTAQLIDRSRPLSSTSIWIPYTHAECGFEFTGVVELEPGEEPTRDDPGMPTQAEVASIFVNGSEESYLDILDPALLQRIAAQVIATFEG